MKSFRTFSPSLLFIVLTLAGHLGWTLLPEFRSSAGIFDHGRWFMDSFAVLAANDGWRAGIPPEAANPYDYFSRSHKYSDWWFALGKMGLTRADNFAVGGLWVLAFLAAVFATVRPRSYGESAWFALVAVSPPVFLGILRANNDLLIFALLAPVLLALQKPTRVRVTLAIAMLAVATGLKFYPAVAVCILLLLRPVRRMLEACAIAGVLIGAALISVAGQLARGTFHIETEIYTFGGRIWLMDLGVGSSLAAWGALVLPGALAAIVVSRRWVPPPRPEAAAASEDERAMTLGAALLAGCFVTGISFGYRLIFALWLVPWIWRNRNASPLLRTVPWLLTFLLWHDALLCWATALWFPNLRYELYEQIHLAWRLATEPLNWIFVTILVGWLLDVLLSALQSLRGEKARSAPLRSPS